jgi:hypothetical protein
MPAAWRQAQWLARRHSWIWVPFPETLSSGPSWEMLEVLSRLQKLALLANWTSEAHGGFLSRTLKPEFLELFGNVVSDVTFLCQDAALFVCCIQHWVRISFQTVRTVIKRHLC